MKRVILFILIIAALALGTRYVLKLYNAAIIPPPTPTLDTAETVRLTLLRLDPANPETFLAIQDIIDLGHEAVEPLIPLIKSDNPLEQWAAVVTLAAVRSQLEDQTAITTLLKPAYESRYATVALHAINSNAIYGDYSGLPIALRTLASDEITMYMDPPGPVSEYAAAILRQVSGENFSFSAYASPTEKRQAIAKWNAWWEVFRGAEQL
ncbi:MAG: hypothetical protein V1738_03790 [Patescibacteria group bacterium]